MTAPNLLESSDQASARQCTACPAWVSATSAASWSMSPWKESDDE
jgi:hypothetical protein